MKTGQLDRKAVTLHRAETHFLKGTVFPKRKLSDSADDIQTGGVRIKGLWQQSQHISYIQMNNE